MKFIKLRLERQLKGSFAACDSSTRSAWGKCIAEIRLGYNKDNPKLKSTIELVVYSLTTHEPVYYRTFTGNCVDVRTIITIEGDLLALNVKDIIFIFDRGYYSNNNIGDLIYEKIPFIMCSKTSTDDIYEYISMIKYDKFGLPVEMKYDHLSKLYYIHFEIKDKIYKTNNGSEVKADSVKYNLYLNINKRLNEIIKINEEINLEYCKCLNMISETNIKSNYKKHNKELAYHKFIVISENNNEKVDIQRKSNIIDKK